jgi:hypothetical protein
MMRKTGIAALSALGILAAGNANALPEGWYTLGPGIPYQCHGNYMTDGSVAPISLGIFFFAADIRACAALCDSRRDCVAFSFQRRVSDTGAVTTGCTLYGRSEVGEVPIGERGRFDWGAVCYRTYPRTDDLQTDWRRRLGLDQDRLRPGLLPSSPPKPNK